MFLIIPGRKAFENGLPLDGDYDAFSNNLEYTAWGAAPNTQVVVNAFDNNLSSRQYEDVGFDGLSDIQESSFFSDFVTTAQTYISDPVAVSKINNDPSSDNYNY